MPQPLPAGWDGMLIQRKPVLVALQLTRHVDFLELIAQFPLIEGAVHDELTGSL